MVAEDRREIFPSGELAGCFCSAEHNGNDVNSLKPNFVCDEGSKAVKQVIKIFALVLICAVSLSAQSATTSQESPKAAIDQFLTMAINGELQTPDGWRKAGVLFAHPNSMLYGKPIIIVGDDYSTRQTWIAGTHAEVIVTYRQLGRIDSSLRYSSPDPSSRKIVAAYDLILTNKGTSVLGSTTQTAGAQWRIENPQRTLWIGLKAAVVYVTEIRDKATDALTKRNASITLMKLRKFQR
ncbi:MAG TPA: hypothetical protein VGR94_09615 [Candidatus Acidoferrales bacterium]|nr:hypothetical protein [Candidatus Acidoferrales bacterium]